MYFILHPYHMEPSHNAATGALVVLKVEWCMIIDKLGSLNRLVHIYTSYGHFKLILKVKGELLLLEKSEIGIEGEGLETHKRKN